MATADTSMKITQGFGLRIKNLRMAAQLNKTEFSRIVLNVSSTRRLTALESEAGMPTAAELKSIAQLSGVPESWIARGTYRYAANDILDIMGIGSRIRKARQQRGITMNALSRNIKLGNTSQNIRRLEIEVHSPRVHTLKRIAKELKVPFRSLAFGS